MVLWSCLRHKELRQPGSRPRQRHVVRTKQREMGKKVTHPKRKVKCKKYGSKVGTGERQPWPGQQVLNVGPWSHHSCEGCEEQCRSQRPSKGEFVSQSCMSATAGTGGIESVCFGRRWKGACALQVILTSHRARNWLFGVSCEIDSLCAAGSCRRPSLFSSRTNGPAKWSSCVGCRIGMHLLEHAGMGANSATLSSGVHMVHKEKVANSQNDEFRRP